MSAFLISAFLALTIGPPSSAAPPATVGEAAPDFTLKDTGGRSHTLSALKGKFVVLEWVNYDCPFCRKHYTSGNMPSLQKEYAGQGVVWLSVCSSAPGKQGYFEGSELTARIARMKATPTAYLIDADGTVGKLYAAKTTPHMFIIDRSGTLVYAGGIDDIASTDVDDIPRAHNYVREALDAAMAGKSVPVSVSRSYGCSVKY